MLNCKSCSFFRAYFGVIIFTAVSVRFFPNLTDLFLPLVLVGVPTFLFRKTPSDLGYRNFKEGILWGLGASLIVLPVYYLGAPHKFPFDFSKFLSAVPFYLGVALGEETFFRGFFYSVFENEKLVGPLTKNNLISSILFGVAHALVYYDPSRFIVFFPSLVMGFLYERSGSIGAPILFHFLSDLTYLFARV